MSSPSAYADFADLPFELRQRIYIEYFEAHLAEKPYTSLFGLWLMRVNRQISREAAKAAALTLTATIAALRVDLKLAQKAVADARMELDAIPNIGRNWKATWTARQELNGRELAERVLRRDIMRLKHQRTRLEKSAARAFRRLEERAACSCHGAGGKMKETCGMSPALVDADKPLRLPLL